MEVACDTWQNDRTWSLEAPANSEMEEDDCLGDNDNVKMWKLSSVDVIT